MSIAVKYSVEQGKPTVFVRSDKFEKSADLDAKRIAIEEATKHLGVCGISGMSGPYPIDPDTGNEIDPSKLAEWFTSKKPIAYQNDFYMMRSF